MEHQERNQKRTDSSPSMENENNAVPEGTAQNSKKANIFTFLIDLITKERGGAIAGFVLALAGVFGFWLSPLKTGVFHLIWEEDANIEIRTSEENVILGKTFTVSVLVYSNSAINVSKGILTLSFFPKDSLVLVEGKTELETEEIEHAKIFPVDDSTPIQFRADGRGKIVANLKTKYKNYSDTVVIVPKYSFGRPSYSNFSGKWFLKVGRSIGEMELVEINDGGGYQLSGTYHLDSGEQGILRGNRDGHTFDVNLIKNNELEKWSLEGEHSITLDSTNFKKYITIEGEAELQRIKDERWQPLRSPVKFRANTRTD